MNEIRIENNSILFTLREYERMDHQQLKKHIHPYHEILYIMDGVIDYIVEDKQYRLKKGDVLVIDSAKYHYVNNIITPPYKRICFEFISSFVGNDELINDVFKKNPHFSLPVDSPIPEILNLIVNSEMSANSGYSNLLYKSSLRLTLLSLLNLNNDELIAKPNLSKTCNNILTYINENITSINNIEQIAEKFFFSKSYISHVFKQEMKVGIMQYIRHKKILIADKLLKKGKRPTEVAKECGYENYISFYRLYSQHFGKPPSTNKGLTKKKNYSSQRKKSK